MKRNYFLLIVMIASVIISSAQAAVVPYLPPLQNFNGASANLSTFLHVNSDYTLEVQGTIGTEISVNGGAYTYTPSASGVVRFAQMNGSVYVYEGNEYKSKLTPVVTTVFPAITDADAATNENNLLQNASFETVGATIATNKFRFGTPWVTNIAEAEFGIRIGTSANVVNGTKVLVWRGSGNSNYYAQKLSANIKPNTSYKIIVRQIDGGNATANFNVGLGSTVNGQEFGFKPISLGSSRNGTWSAIVKTPAVVSDSAFFTFKNTAANSASSGSDPVTQLDYLALVEGVEVLGITGVSSATFLSGAAYAPEGITVDFAAGDYFDATHFIVNPTISEVDGSGVPVGWSAVKGTGNTFTTTGQHYSGVTSNRYIDSWNGTAGSMLYNAQQLISNLPNGFYRLTSAARTSGVGSYIYAKAYDVTYKTQIIVNNSTGGTLGNGFNTIVVDDILVLDGKITIGVTTDAAISGGTPWAGTWFSADDFTLSLVGVYSEPFLTVSASSLSFTPSSLQKSLNILAGNISQDITLTASEGFSVSSATIAAADAMSADGVDVTVTSAGNTEYADGTLTIVSGSLEQTIALSFAETAISVSHAGIFLDNSYNPEVTITVTGDLMSNISLTAPNGILLSQDVISAADAIAGKNITVNWDGATRVNDLNIVLVSGVKTAEVKVFAVNDNIISSWDGDNAEGDGSKLTDFGWTLNNAAGDNIAASFNNFNATSGIRYVSFTPSLVYTYQGKTWVGNRIAYLRTWAADASNTYNLAVELEANVTYEFRGVAAWHNNETNPTFTYAIRDGKASSANVLASQANQFTVRQAGADYKFEFTPQTTGTHYVSVSSSQPNDAMGAPMYLAVYPKLIGTSVEKTHASNINVYPTVTDGSVRVMAGENAAIRLFDLSGRMVMNKVGVNAIEMVELPSAGIFFLEVNNGIESKTVKVIRVK